MVAGTFTPYSTVEAFLGTLPSWVPMEDQQRIASYQIYEEIYWNHPTTFKLVHRGTESRPIYLPSGRIIVETFNRYFCKGFDFRVDPTVGTPAEQELARATISNFFAREEFHAKFKSAKRFGLIRGDWVFHLTADPLKPPGSRLSLNIVDPASLFKVYGDDLHPDRVTKIHLAEQFLDVDGTTTKIRRQTYEKSETGQVLWTVSIWKTDEFAKPDGKPERVEPPIALPADITGFPVYHIKNFNDYPNPFGSSEMRGLEIMMAAMNQSISDEDIALALEGLGLYATDSGGPTDDDGNPSDWILGPGRVVENAANFRRINGINTVQPSQDHVNSIFRFMKDASASPDAAMGNIDVQVAESGIALRLKMDPILSKASESQDGVSAVMDHLFWDLKGWFKAYEGINFVNALITTIFGDPLPVNQSGEIDKVIKMVMSDPPIMSATTAREYLASKGIEFSPDELQRIMDEKRAMADAELGTQAEDTNRLNAEANPQEGSDAEV